MVRHKNGHSRSSAKKPIYSNKSGRKRKSNPNTEKSTKKIRSYKDSHAVGKRRSSQFVTYSQDDRLFYDLYTRYAPTSISAADSSSRFDDLSQNNSVAKRSAESHTQKRLKKRSQREASLNASAKMTVLCQSSSEKIKSISSVRRPSQAKTSKCPRPSQKSTLRKLKRELGIDSLRSAVSYGKRMASLNATALITAEIVSCCERRTRTGQLSQKKSSAPQTLSRGHSADPSVDDIADKSDDAATEPMMHSPVVDDNLAVMHHSSSPKSEVRVPTITLSAHSSESTSVAVTAANVLSIADRQLHNQTVESCATKNVISARTSQCRVQKITQQIIHVNYNKPSLLPHINTYSMGPIVQTSSPSSSNYVPMASSCNILPTFHYAPCSAPISLPCNLQRPDCPPIACNSAFALQHPNHLGLVFPPQVYPTLSPQMLYPICNYYGQPLGFNPIPSASSLHWTFAGMTSLPAFGPNLHVSHCPPTSPNVFCPPVTSTTCVLSNITPSAEIPASAITSTLPTTQLFSPSPTSQACNVFRKTPADATSGPNSMDPSTTRGTTSASSSMTSSSIASPGTSLDTRNIRTVGSNTGPSVSVAINTGSNRTSAIHRKSNSSEASLRSRRSQRQNWTWEGECSSRLVRITSDGNPVLRSCYGAIRHCQDGMLIREKDNVLLCSGPDRCAPPHVAKITALFEDPLSGEKMLALLWYYRPEHIPGVRLHDRIANELFASRHCDANSVDCIEDKAYVLTANAFARYMARLKLHQSAHPRLPLSSIVPSSVEDDLDELLPPQSANGAEAQSAVSSLTNVFFCRSFYDFRSKRVCKSVGSQSTVNQSTWPKIARHSNNTSANSSPEGAQSVTLCSFSRSLPRSPKPMIAESPKLPMFMSHSSPADCGNGIDESPTTPSQFSKSIKKQSMKTPCVASSETSNESLGNSSPIPETNSFPCVATTNRSAEADQDRTPEPSHRVDSVQSVNWNPVQVIMSSTILETSADLSVNWAEHGEQIAMCLGNGTNTKDPIFPSVTNETFPLNTESSQSTYQVGFGKDASGSLFTKAYPSSNCRPDSPHLIIL